ncbi:hypothetical protein MKZ38_000829 [Zalerion maritima]|uniref:Uncharacterized protein n=1 Tax=Zalerion maritima TaxID=339359 RepID=A0AAD5RSD3_9PEZI|nr:hypothetical protein MKZ38_000829 [Zalerion maritima]
MSIYQDNGQGENDYMSGGKNLGSGNETYNMTALEVGTICGTIVAFILVMFFVFYCRRIDTRRKKGVDCGGSSTGPDPGTTPHTCDCPGSRDGLHDVNCSARRGHRHGDDDNCQHVPGSADTYVTETSSTKGRVSGDMGREHSDCTEMKSITSKPTTATSDKTPIAMPPASYPKDGSVTNLAASDRDVEACYSARGKRGSGWTDGVHDGKKRLSGIRSKVGGWRAGKRQYSRAEDNDPHV